MLQSLGSQRVDHDLETTTTILFRMVRQQITPADRDGSSLQAEVLAGMKYNNRKCDYWNSQWDQAAVNSNHTHLL